MKDDLKDIKNLRDKVKAGTAMHGDFRCLEVPMQDMRYTELPNAARMSYKGSLDAAKTLDEGMIPGHIKAVVDMRTGEVQMFNRCDDEWVLFLTINDISDPARAWLCGILEYQIECLQ